MNITRKIGIGLVAGALTVGAGATAFAAGAPAGAGGDGSGTKGAFVCAHLEEIQAQQQTHLDLLGGRVHLLQEAHDAATAAGDDRLATKIEARLERTNARLGKVTDRQGKLAGWAAEHCSTTPPAGG